MDIKTKVQEGIVTTKEIGDKAVSLTESGAKKIAEKSSETLSDIRTKKYRPVFPEDYNNPKFSRPNLIQIVDDAERYGIKECEGAIGWLDTVNDTQILKLYDCAVEDSGIQFIPSPTCDDVFSVDPFDNSRYINVERFFNIVMDERIAELKQIAFCLGAKRFRYQLTEENMSIIKSKFREDVKVKETVVTSADIAQEGSIEKFNKNYKKKSIDTEVNYSGSNTLTKPNLHWFKNDKAVNSFIEMRLNPNVNVVKNDKLEISFASSQVMGQANAAKIEGVYKAIHGKIKIKLQKEAKVDCNKKLHIVFDF